MTGKTLFTRFYHFFGGVPFALILIFTTGLFAIAGTFIESITGSHRYASLFTYGNPFFTALLCGFFINILISALRRYPFKSKHAPFLITHFGMLMILTGALIKSYWGVQGNLLVSEGTSSDKILMPGTYALSIETRKQNSQQFYPIDQFSRYLPLRNDLNDDDLSITLLDFTPHSTEKLETWIKDHFLILFGQRPIPLQKDADDHPFSPFEAILNDSKWHIYAILSDNEKEVAKKIYLEGIENASNDPTLLFIQDSLANTTLYVFTEEKQVQRFYYPDESKEGIYMYDEGFLGYTREVKIPIPPKKKETPSQELLLGTPLTKRHQTSPPSHLLEDNCPCVALRIKKGDQEELITLRYDKHANGLKWPLFNGEYLVRFQPSFKAIPYKIRLRQARQINYAHTNQAYSYESDLLVTDKRTNKTVESQISMNHVHETWDGFRFYLSNITPSDKGVHKHIQIVVNRDPAKYWLTYPGACFMALGILGLFFRKSMN